MLSPLGRFRLRDARTVALDEMRYSKSEQLFSLSVQRSLFHFSRG